MHFDNINKEHLTENCVLGLFLNIIISFLNVKIIGQQISNVGV